MARQVLIIHGWSDTSRSFHALATFLAGHDYAPKLLWLGDYISRYDDVRVEDVGKRMGEVIADMSKAGELDKSFDVIVHSTGGLVAREWLTSWYRGGVEQCPMKRTVMLAPANYGSKLAATGKSFLGRIVKGYDNWFQSGKAMLNDLELSSPFQWALAQRDVLQMPGADSNRYYGKDGVWPFVIVGTHPYASALRQIVNENGSDGTVRVCAANLNARGVTFDFRETDLKKLVTVWGSRLEADVPLAVLPTRTHGSIIDPDRADKDNQEKIPESPDEKRQLGELVLQALGCRDFDEYRSIHAAWDAISEQTTARRAGADDQNAEYFHQYMQMNACVVDDQGHPVDDYFLEFFSSESKRNDDANVYLHRNVLESVKKNSEFAYLRNLYFDRTDLVENYYKMLPKGTAPTLYMSISAAAPGNNINYFEREKTGAEQRVPVHLEGDQTKRWLRRNTTHFVQIVIPRMPNANVFRLTNFSDAK
jgi:pimeloyl-ACP methyl ester carboxylesterase